MEKTVTVRPPATIDSRDQESDPRAMERQDRFHEIDRVLQRAATIAARYLAGHDDRDEPVMRLMPAEQLRAQLRLDPPTDGRPLDELWDDLQTVLDFSVRTGHPGFSNQLYGGYTLPGVIGEWMTALLNSSMYTYEVAPVATLMETALLAHMGRLAGFDDCEGVLTPGGTMSNLMATLMARDHVIGDARVHGVAAGPPLAMFVSEESHYSFKRAASVIGIGFDAVYTMPTDDVGRVTSDGAAAAVRRAIADGRRPFMMVSTSGSTVAGAYDPIPALESLAREHDMWFHVDAAYGGGALLSSTHRRLLEGCERADSLTWCPHKMMGVPLLCSAILVRERGHLVRTTSVEADYLFHDDDPWESCDLGHISLQCGRRIDALKLWLSWQAHGDAGYERRIDRKFELARAFRRMVIDRAAFELSIEPEACNVCFHYVPTSLRGQPMDDERGRTLDALTRRIRARLLEEGRYLTNYATVKGLATFRLVMNNADALESDLAGLLDAIERIGDELG
jgi:glutamate/tyrosine decarboxylase-like PLP-dependent enzyme